MTTAIVLIITWLPTMVFAYWSNNDWYKKCRRFNDEWFEHCQELNKSWWASIKRLENRIDELENRIKKMEDES